MGQLRCPGKVKLFVGLLSSDKTLFQKVKKVLQEIFGPVDFESDMLEFTHTDYYAQELGANLKRKFLSFERCIGLKNIYKVKLRTNLVEKRFSKSGKRSVNIDPGYVDLSKVVLFSTKDYSHRICLNNGIFAEATLFYKDKKFNPWPWTYPDYKSQAYVSILNLMRDIYKNQS